ncbi:MAG: TetR/AcrR family transcriptional regulator [Pseudomonadales bacterium]
MANNSTKTGTSKSTNLNDSRSDATRRRLIASAISSLVEVGFTRTTGVEICRRANLTRGALNHHYPDFADLLTDTLQEIYAKLLSVKFDGKVGVLEQITLETYSRVTQPECKAVIELWLASKNDAAFGQRLSLAINESASLFSPEMVLAEHIDYPRAEEFESIYRTITEALIGIGLGRAVGDGEPMAHEKGVVDVLLNLARQYDSKHTKPTLSANQ